MKRERGREGEKTGLNSAHVCPHASCPDEVARERGKKRERTKRERERRARKMHTVKTLIIMTRIDGAANNNFLLLRKASERNASH